MGRTADKGNLRPLTTEEFRDQFHQRFIRAALVCRSLHGEFQHAVVLPDHAALPGSRLGTDGENHSLWVRGDHAVSFGEIPSNNAEPIRMRVAPSSMATSKSLVMPI